VTKRRMPQSRTKPPRRGRNVPYMTGKQGQDRKICDSGSVQRKNRTAGKGSRSRPHTQAGAKTQRTHLVVANLRAKRGIRGPRLSRREKVAKKKREGEGGQAPHWKKRNVEDQSRVPARLHKTGRRVARNGWGGKNRGGGK